MHFDSLHVDFLFDLLRWRRDVRWFRPDPVSVDHIALLAQAMALAPSVGNSRPWRVVQVEDQHLRGQVLEDHRRANAAAAGHYSSEESEAYRALKLAGLAEAPLHLAVFTDPAPSAGRGLGRRTMPETLPYSTVMAIHSLWLVARSLNLGLGWVSILDPRHVRQILEVDPRWRLCAYLCIGHPQFDADHPELEELGWQQGHDTSWIVR